ncbi:unnamed protein product [Pleuronectes platessa]|uniref:Uncharacterized protein n=1 Tax=Pleuronectes platessa TaxID=8262 RepID=A0A9N7UV34_PLEPL|nr:unnamed protein product [Pleuronectes platessa]
MRDKNKNVSTYHLPLVLHQNSCQWSSPRSPPGPHRLHCSGEVWLTREGFLVPGRTAAFTCKESSEEV